MSSTSVRPMTESEKMHGAGEPLVTMTTLFGMTQGLIAHMNWHSLSIKNTNYFPTVWSKFMGFTLIGGGMILGRLAG